MMLLERIGHDVVKVGEKWFVVDTCKTPDAGWETAIAEIDLDEFGRVWTYEFGEVPTEDDIREYGEEFSDLCWDVVQNYRGYARAEKGHYKWCEKGL